MVGALSIWSALRTTVRWSTNIVSQTWTRSRITDYQAFRMWTTRRWSTWFYGVHWTFNWNHWQISKYFILKKRLNTNWNATCKWIAFKPRWTTAYGVMVNNGTSSTNSTVPNARIVTFLVRAGLCQWAFATMNALWSTCGWSTNISLNTWTNRLTVESSALTVWSTRWWMAGVQYDFILKNYMICINLKLTIIPIIFPTSDWVALNKCISFHSIKANAHWNVR